MSEPQICPQCGGGIPDGAPAGLCPKCLILAGLESRPPVDPSTAATEPPPSSASTGFVPPTVEEVAAKFPQLEVLELLGRGGMGAVYKARQRELDRLVAVKILPPEVSREPAFAERFTREARALARLNHPNIVGVYDFGKTPSSPGPLPEEEGRIVPLFYFIMEYVDGVNLRQAIQAGGMDAKQALAIVPQICDALQFAHDEGVVHRDIKPENILIDKRGRVKIADFGLAKLLGQEAVDHGLTATQQVMGTLRYMAPEQMEGTKTVDHRADIYSLGVVFYELLTGELPIGRFAPPSRMVEIDVRLDEVILRALEKKPEQRYQHASEVKTDMASIAGSPAAPSAAPIAPAAPVAAASASDSAGSDRGFVAVLVMALGAAWTGLLICEGGDHVPFGLPEVPPLVVGLNLLLPVLAAILAGGIVALIWRRPNEEWFERFVKPAPMLIGCHLFVFSIAMFTSLFPCLEWESVMLRTPDLHSAILNTRSESLYHVGAWQSWVGKLGTFVAFLGLFALLTAAAWPRSMRVRAGILIFAGLITFGAVLEYIVLRPPAEATFTREQYQAFDPEHAGGYGDYSYFISHVEAELERAGRELHPAPADYDRIKAEYSRIVVQHYFFDEVAWFLLPGGLLMLCGVFMLRQAEVTDTVQSATPRLAPLAAIGAFVGVAGPLACVPGFVVGFLMLERKEYLWGHEPSMAFMIGLVGMLVFTGISLLLMSILGAAAIGQIRRSGGKFFGLRLALLEALFCPAIALCWVAFFVLALVLSALPRPKNAGMAISPPLFAVFVFAVVTIALIYWRLWRKLRQSPQRPGEIQAEKPRSIAVPSVAMDQSSTVGKISLWTAIIGIVAPTVLFTLGNIVTQAQRLSEEYFMLYFAMCIVMELVAFGFGIVGRRMTTGKVGLVVSMISIVLAGLLFALTAVREDKKAAPATATPGRTSGSLVPLEQSGKFTFIANPPNGPTDQEGVIYFPIPYASPPNIELGGDAGEVVIVDSTSKSFKWRNAGFLGQFHVSWTARGARGNPDDSDSAPAIAPHTPKAPTGVARAANPYGLHPGKQVPPTPAELSHILDELPKEFTKDLLGSVPATVSELDTQVFAIDFDDGPADFWLQVRETGQQTFPVRLPSRNETESWRIPKAKAHILMWIQARQSVGMSDRVRGALAKTPPGCSLGIDVDGKAVARINYDTPVGGVNQAVPNPLWAGWASKELRAEDAPYDRDMMSQAIIYIGRESMAHGATTSCRLGLMYRPDRQEKERPIPAAQATPEQTSAAPSRVAPGVAYPFGLHPGKQVPPTPKELAHILAELPKDLTKGLQGSDEQRIMDLDTRVFAIEFDDGPADFWLQAKETEQQTFPDRVPSRNAGDTRRIPATKARILMWIQPQQSDMMSAQLRGVLPSRPPGCSLGIDVDGEPAARVKYDQPISGVNQWATNPLFSFGSKEMHPGEVGFDGEMASQAILYIGRTVQGRYNLTPSFQLGLMYRPDRVHEKNAQ